MPKFLAIHPVGKELTLDAAAPIPIFQPRASTSWTSGSTPRTSDNQRGVSEPSMSGHASTSPACQSPRAIRLPCSANEMAAG